MTKPKDEHVHHNELRRQKAAELIAQQLRKRRRERTDAALLTAADTRDGEQRPATGGPKPPGGQGDR